jgi:Inosine-uridine preferring nucleoside hydrolase
MEADDGDRAPRDLPSPKGAIQGPVLDGFGNVFGFDSWGTFQVGNRAGHLPIAGGSSVPLVRRLITAKYVHGNNGLGGVDFPAPKIKPAAETATELISRLVHDNPGQITIVAVARSPMLQPCCAPIRGRPPYSRDCHYGRLSFGREHHPGGRVQSVR